MSAARSSRSAGARVRNGHRRSDSDALAALAPDPARAAGAVLWTGLLALAVVRALLVSSHDQWAWALDLQRFLAAPVAAALWGAAAVPLVPALGRRLGRALGRALAPLGRRAWTEGAAWGAGLAGLVAAFPDRVRFVGDFLLREGTLSASGVKIPAWYPQAMPLDLLVHDRLARPVMAALGLGANGYGRLLGVLEAGALGVVSTAFARAAGLRGAAATAATATLALGGALTLFTGYDKAFTEMFLLTVATGACAVRLVRTGRGLPLLALALALAIGFHRLGYGLLAGAAVAVALARRAHPDALAGRALAAWLALPLATALALAPRVIHVFAVLDRMQLSPGPGEPHAWWAAALAGARPADLANVAVLYAPLALLVPAMAVAAGARRPRPEAVALVALALPFVAAAPLLHPGQGLFRDWDVFSPMGAGLALLAAWTVGRVLQGSRSLAWLALPVALGMGSHAIAWLAHSSDETRGLARVHALLDGPPARTGDELAKTWQFVGIHQARARRWRRSAAAYGHAAEYLPSPHILRQWAVAATEAGDLDGARDVYLRLLAAKPDDASSWLALAVLDQRRRDPGETLYAARRARRYLAGDAQLGQVISALEAQGVTPAAPPGVPPERGLKAPPPRP